MSQKPCMWLMVVHEADGWVSDFLTKCHQEPCFIEYPLPPYIEIVSLWMHSGFFNLILKCRIRRPCDISEENRHPCDILVFVFY